MYIYATTATTSLPHAGDVMYNRDFEHEHVCFNYDNATRKPVVSCKIATPNANMFFTDDHTTLFCSRVELRVPLKLMPLLLCNFIASAKPRHQVLQRMYNLHCHFCIFSGIMVFLK